MKQLPPLDKKTFDVIVYEMENQESEAFFHPKANAVFYYDIGFAEFEVMPGVETDEDFELFCTEGFPLPVWSPKDGFSAMEDFSRDLKNPSERDLLLRSLEGGRGVFRRFKDTLDEFSDKVRGEWFSFKERRMGELVKKWYEELGGELAFIDMEEQCPEDYDETVLTNFSVSDHIMECIDWIVKADQKIIEGLSLSSRVVALSLRAGFSPIDKTEEDSIVLVALDPEDRPVGFIWAGVRESAALVLQVCVLDNFRRAGLGDLLITQLERKCLKMKLKEVILTLPSALEFFTEAQKRGGAVCDASVLVRKL